MRGLFTLIIATIAALVGGVIGFQLGVTSNIGAAGGTVVWHAGFRVLRVLLPVPVLLPGPRPGLRAAFGGRRRGWGGGPGWGGGLRPERLKYTATMPDASGSPTPTASSTRTRPAPAG